MAIAVPAPSPGARHGAAPSDWRAVLADAVTDPAELCRLLDLPASWAAAATANGFRLLVPRPFLARIQRGDPHDPLLRQVLPQAFENQSPPDFNADPVGDSSSSWGAGLLRKYQGRVLMVTIGACAVHCRFCFRRHFPYQQTPSHPQAWNESLRKIAEDPSIEEVILSGGDPLMVEDRRLAELADRLAQIPHVARLRVHTRLPIVIPQRITDALIAWLRGTRLTPVFVIHVNHPAEMDEAVVTALGRLIDAGIPVLSQSVLLKGVNDQRETLVALFRRLVNIRVMPYYLHQLDRVAGAAHFEVPEEEGSRLIRELRSRLPGYAVPRYVRETPHGQSKEILV